MDASRQEIKSSTTRVEWQAIFEFEFRTVAHTNTREHWAVTQGRKKREKEALAFAWMGAGSPRPPFFPVSIHFTRIARGVMDEDNLQSSCKYFRDELARRLGFKNDNAPELVFAPVAQAKPDRFCKQSDSQWVRVEIRCVGDTVDRLRNGGAL